MVIIDFYNLITGSIRRLFMEEKCAPDVRVVRQVALNSILFQIQKHSKYADEVVIAFDTKTNWRSRVFPNYKLQRLKNRKDDFDYKMFYESLEVVKLELTAVLPYKCLEVDLAEADDIIGVLARIYAIEKGDVCIVSSDKDFVHLQALELPFKIVQYSPFKNDFIDESTLEMNLFEHIIGGDSADGIPNIWSDDDVFLVDDKRQKSFTKAKKQELNSLGFEKFYENQDDEVKRKIDRNMLLIDLTKIPSDVTSAIIMKYVRQKPNFGMLYPYLIDKRLDLIIERFGGLMK